MRVTLANEIVVTNYIQPVNDADDIPPSSILTLRLADSNAENNTFTLSWQAVGDDFDTGKGTSMFESNCLYIAKVRQPKSRIALEKI